LIVRFCAAAGAKGITTFAAMKPLESTVAIAELMEELPNVLFPTVKTTLPSSSVPACRLLKLPPDGLLVLCVSINAVRFTIVFGETVMLLLAGMFIAEAWIVVAVGAASTVIGSVNEVLTL
jgi:hypothetical protein